MNQACTPFLAKHRILQQRCLDIACNNNVQDLNKLKPRLCLDSCLVIRSESVNYHHYLNAFQSIVSTSYIVGRLHKLVITSETSPEPQPNQHLLTSEFIRSINTTIRLLRLASEKLFRTFCWY